MKRMPLVIAVTIVLAAVAQFASAQHTHDPSHGAGRPADARMPVEFPAELREHTLTNMRDHLLAIAQIQEALSKARFDEAGTIAEQRLGMSSLKLHGAHEVTKYMPQGMQDAGTAMHRGASRFALAAQNASVTGDAKPALAELSVTTQTCVDCHAAYRLK